MAGGGLPRVGRAHQGNGSQRWAAALGRRGRAGRGLSHLSAPPRPVFPRPLTPHSRPLFHTQVLADVRSIIAEQLGADLDKVREAERERERKKIEGEGRGCQERAAERASESGRGRDPRPHSPSFSLPPSTQVGPDAKFADLGADSLDTVEIMMALEEKFEVTLDEDGAEGLATVQDAADLIISKM